MINDERNSITISLKGIRSFSDALKSFQFKNEGATLSIVETRLYRSNSKRYSVEYATTPEKAAVLGRVLYRSYYDREYVYALAFSSKMEPLAATLLSVGGISSAIIDPGRLFSFAILASANSIMLFHNHVSGLPNPSKEDENISKRIKECGELMGIPLSDHIIIGKETYYSMKERGII